MNKAPILLSTDIGSDPDDALALDVILNAGINLRGVYTVNGDVISRAYIAHDIISKKDKTIAIGVGESESLSGTYAPYSICEEPQVQIKYINLEESGMKTVFKPIEQFGIRRSGIADMAKKLSEEKHTLFSIGPLTNIALLLEQYPESTSNIEKLYIMGCRFDNESMEHNVRFDIKAAIDVFDSNIPIIVVPGDVCQNYKMPTQYLEQLETMHGLSVKRTSLAGLALDVAHKIASTSWNDYETLRNAVTKNPGNSGSSLKTFLYDFIYHDVNITNRDFLKDIHSNDAQKIYKKKKQLFENLKDHVYASMDPADFFEDYNKLIDLLKDEKFNYLYGNEVAQVLEGLKKTNMSVADVFVPYCYMNPDKIETTLGNVTIDPDFGRSTLTQGVRHEVVTKVYYSDFDKYLKEYLK